MTSYEGCKSIAKKHSNQAFSWCRKGYESVLSSLSPLLDTLKKIDKEQKSAETTNAIITKESVVVSEPSVTIENTVVPVTVESVVKTDVNISKVEETAQNESVVEKKIEEPVEKKIEEEPVKKIEPIVRKPINTYRHQEQVVHKPVDKASLTIEAKDEPEEEPSVDEVKEKLDKKEDKTTEEESTTDTETTAIHDDPTSFKDDNEEEKKADTDETEEAEL